MASRTRLAIIGASVRAAAQSAHRAGHDVVAADLFADEDLRSLCPASRVRCYPDGFVDWLAGVEADAWMYTGGLEQWPDLVDRLARLKPLWGNGGTPLRRVRDLETLLPILRKAGLAVPETRATPAGLPLDGSWLCKAGGSGGVAVWALDSSESLEHGERVGAHYQRRLTNLQGSAASVVLVLGDGWSRTIGVTRQLIGSGFGAKPFQYAGSYGPVKISPTVRRQLHTLEQTLREALCLRGVVGVDLWLSNDSLWVLEVNPRYTASVEVLELAGAGPVLDMHVRAFANVDPPNPSTATPAIRESAKKRILYARKSFQAPASVPHWVSAPDQGGNRFWIADVPAPDQHFDPGDPVLTVMGHGNVVDTQAFDEFVAAIERWLYAEATPTPRRR